MTDFSEIISTRKKPALLIGNGINLFSGIESSTWKHLLGKLARAHNLKLNEDEADEMSNTEFFDILDLAKPSEDKSTLQKEFCELMADWQPRDHHTAIVNWACRHNSPVITVNFDETLSKSIGTSLYRHGRGFTDFYPWNSYFSERPIADPRSSFAIWHAHGMVRYSRSIRLGLTHYMGSVQRARSWLYGDCGLRALASNGNDSWRGRESWLDIILFCPLVIFGFSFGQDESFMRWLFLERARIHKIRPEWRAKTYFVDTPKNGSLHRKPFFEGLGIEYIAVRQYSDIYSSAAWRN